MGAGAAARVAGIDGARDAVIAGASAANAAARNGNVYAGNAGTAEILRTWVAIIALLGIAAAARGQGGVGAVAGGVATVGRAGIAIVATACITTGILATAIDGRVGAGAGWAGATVAGARVAVVAVERREKAVAVLAEVVGAVVAVQAIVHRCAGFVLATGDERMQALAVGPVAGIGGTRVVVVAILVICIAFALHALIGRA